MKDFVCVLEISDVNSAGARSLSALEWFFSFGCGLRELVPVLIMIYTANKLLSARDLHDARSFAIRAREFIPRFEATNLLLTIIDTLLVGEARIK
ncbi:chaperone DnaJ-domain protein [Trifolium pratense]|uniref:Chaperone DnaJ-domain protein n=1 Tax=Trifolium pratense TaxID=57577 RepID=A0A2K3P8R3_TRIPR|nr:chaperone DnaJ-domain protein [Trifolium pratense]